MVEICCTETAAYETCREPHELTLCRHVGVWLLASHDPVGAADIEASLTPAKLATTAGPVLFKFEPFILHVQCRTLEAARSMLTVALDAGMR